MHRVINRMSKVRNSPHISMWVPVTYAIACEQLLNGQANSLLAIHYFVVNYNFICITQLDNQHDRFHCLSPGRQSLVFTRSYINNNPKEPITSSLSNECR